MAVGLGFYDWENAVAGTTPGTVKVTAIVQYVGTDVPNGRDTDLVVVDNLDVSRTPAQIASDTAAAIRARASSIGITLPPNTILISGLVKG